MLVLDNDHLSVLGEPTPAGARLLHRLSESGEPVATTVVNVEESLRGWLAQIHRAANAGAEIIAYQRFQKRVEFFAEWMVLPWDAEAAQRIRRLRAQRLRTATHGSAHRLHHAGTRCPAAHTQREGFRSGARSAV